MPPPHITRTSESVQETLVQIVQLLHRHRIVETLVHQQTTHRRELVESLVHKQHLAELQQKLDRLHAADIAYILEALPREERLVVWDLVKAERDGDILVEVSDAVRESLIADMDSEELLAAAEQLDADEIADIADDLPPEVMQELLLSLNGEDRAQLQSALSYPDDHVGHLMDFDMVLIREDVTLEVVLRYLRRFEELPDQADKLFVVDRKEHLRGVLPLKRLLVSDPEVLVRDVMAKEIVAFHPDEDAAQAAQAFERYDLVSAPVIDPAGKLIGRITIEAVLDFIREESDAEVLSSAGLREEEDLFAPVWKSIQNRWLWLGINLVTAFVASRVIGGFEDTIEKLVALAALMPIVAGIGGNSANQTTTLIIRSLALGTLNQENIRAFVKKEFVISALNGLVWGTIVGGFAYMLYDHPKLGMVMAAAMFLELLLAAFVGMFIPLLMHRLGRDPAVGSSVLLTATTDSMGFFIFLGLAKVFLM